MYIGCSTHSVPSLSNVAIRSCGGTKSGLPSVVTFFTNARIACFEGPSFQDGSGSSAAALEACATTASGCHAQSCFCCGAEIAEVVHGRAGYFELEGVEAARPSSCATKSSWPTPIVTCGLKFLPLRSGMNVLTYWRVGGVDALAQSGVVT